MPIIQGGPPEWIWERTPGWLQARVVPVAAPEGHMVYELRLSSGLEILRVQFLTEQEVARFRAALDRLGHERRKAPRSREGVQNRRRGGVETHSLREGQREQVGVVSDPDQPGMHREDRLAT